MPKKNSRIDIRLPEDEKVKFARLVKRLGETISETLRRWIHESVADGRLSGKGDASK